MRILCEYLREFSGIGHQTAVGLSKTAIFSVSVIVLEAFGDKAKIIIRQ